MYWISTIWRKMYWISFFLQKLSKKYAKRKKEEKEHLLSRNNYIRLLQLQILTKTRLLRAETFSLPSASPPFSLFFFLDIYVILHI